MKSKNRKILLILDNASCHSINSTFSHVDILFLPKNTTSLIQPCDQGIIKAFKDRFNNLMIKSIIFDKSVENSNLDVVLKGITILDAICITRLAWDELSSDTIINCFKKAFQKPSIMTGGDKENSEETTTIETVDIDYVVDNTVQEFIDCNISESSDEIIDNVNDVESFEYNFKSMVRFVKKYCPHLLLQLYRFKIEILTDYRKSMKKQLSLLDFFIKK